MNPCLQNIIAQAGYQTIGSLVFLHELVKQIQPDYVLELGTGYGCSAAFMALALGDNGKLISVDDCRDEAKCMDIPARNLKSCGLDDKTCLIQGSTFNVAPLVSERFGNIGPELIFQDASHNFRDCVREYESVVLLVHQVDHLLVVDDLFAQDMYYYANWLNRQPCYGFGVVLKYHHGMLVLGTNKKYLPIINAAWEEAGAQ